ncbi:MAG: 2-succinyl-5-enolpyruvyl-6-hydroxy-3-cyclohexene-1-carboxylic-acid synthase [Sporolactobacillus sp.]
MKHEQQMARYIAAWIDKLVQDGVRDMVISPGSRSTPFALLIEADTRINTYCVIDERSAAFLALGLAKTSQRTVALLCTSGTAAANYFPAVVEAKLARVPLLVFTADRPYELQQIGAPQTIGQAHLYGEHVKAFYQLEIPEELPDWLGYHQMILARAADQARTSPRGPVHINLPFREPLVPELVDEGPAPTIAPVVHSGRRMMAESELETAAASLKQAKRVVIVCGALESDKARDAIVSLAERLHLPLLADPLAQIRGRSHANLLLIDTYDTFLRNEKAAARLKADLIIRFGAMPVSKSLTLWMKGQHTDQWLIDEGSEWRDPTGQVTQMFICDQELFCRQLCTRLDEAASGGWQNLWRRLNQLAQTEIQRQLDTLGLTEETAFHDCLGSFPEDAAVFVGNSMPIRRLDAYWHGMNKKLTVYANRGANGIDGVVSTAVGMSLGHPAAFLMIGDLSFFHDMNGLLAARQLKSNLTIVLINNDGGGIFSFLAQAQQKTYFEKLFGTPHGLDFSHSAALYDAFYRRVTTRHELMNALDTAAHHHGLAIIEVPTTRAANVTVRQLIDAEVDRKMGRVLAGDRE